MKFKNIRLFAFFLIITILLLVPLIAMQFSNEVNWSVFDFSIAAILLLSIGLSCELLLRKIKKPKHRIILCIVLLVCFFLIWAELSVGIFGAPFGGH